MIDLSGYKGLSQFGPAYEVMLSNDPHAPGSVDRVLMENMVRLCVETVEHLYGDYTPAKSCYDWGMRPDLERYVQEAVSGAEGVVQRIDAIARFTSGLRRRAVEDIESMLVGGTEEEIIVRGSDWCPDVARVACALYQVAGFAARIVYLAELEKAYSAHVIVEAFGGGFWGAIDSLTGIVYRHPDRRPASVWELMHNPELVMRHSKAGSIAYARPGQFRAAAISNYSVCDWRGYDYTASRLNDYYRSVLKMAEQGWPGGLRWLHGEDT